MIRERPAFERRLLNALAAAPARIPVILGGCSSGKTSTLLRLREHLGPPVCQYIDVERTATTPERFLRAVLDSSPFADRSASAAQNAANARTAFEAVLSFLEHAQSSGGAPAVFLLDEALELRTFESFPGLRRAVPALVEALERSSNGFVLGTRYSARALRLFREAPSRFEIIQIPPLTPGEVRASLPRSQAELDTHTDGEISRSVFALADGRPGYAASITDMMTAMEAKGGGDPISALCALLTVGGVLADSLRFTYELRLHRARGYGALKAILEVLAEEEPLTLTEIAQRLHRTPGSTKDYLSWLEDVDLIAVRGRRYSFADPLLRLWVRLYCRTVPPSDDDLGREVQRYAMARMPAPEPALVAAGAVGPNNPMAGVRNRSWGIIEID